MCHKDSTRNLEYVYPDTIADHTLTDDRMILTYLIPCHLLTTHTLPSAQLLKPFPALQALFLNLSVAIRTGDLHAFDKALAQGEDEFIKRRIYLTLERGRDIALRNLLRKVFLAGGYMETKHGEQPVRRTRIPVAEFVAAMNISGGEPLDVDEVECLLANMIFKVCHTLPFKSFRARVPYRVIILSAPGRAHAVAEIFTILCLPRRQVVVTL
jgi:hypothetical protein